MDDEFVSELNKKIEEIKNLIKGHFDELSNEEIEKIKNKLTLIIEEIKNEKTASLIDDISKDKNKSKSK